MKLTTEYDPRFNFTLKAFRDGRLVAVRRVHNVMVNNGREWLSKRVGSSDYTNNTDHTSDKIKWMGFGCGGALQTDNQFANTQSELVTVVALEDPTPFSLAGVVPTYLKQVQDQSLTTEYFPGDYRTIFVLNIAETEISYTAAVTHASGIPVGTSVPISEAGLYLTGAVPDYTPGPETGVPTAANELACYNIFDPISVTPDMVLRAEWEIRF